jgi:hypothetical protein
VYLSEKESEKKEEEEAAVAKREQPFLLCEVRANKRDAVEIKI